MKKLICALLAVLMLCTLAAAEDIDLSGLSFQELAVLRNRCLYEMMQRDEWQEVTVPQGNYLVGRDIPAGTWLVRCADNGRESISMRFAVISWGKGKPQDGRVPYPRKGEADLYNPNGKYYEGEMTEFIIELEEGDWVAIKPDRNAVVFTPYTGTPNLGFK